MEVMCQLHAPGVLPSEKVIGTYFVGGWMSPQKRSEHCGVKKNILPLPEIEIRQFSLKAVSILTELSRLLSCFTEVVAN
jgi:hypothetical protein